MNALVHKRIHIGLVLVSVLGIALSFALLFQAGCTGDPKTGALGNPVRSLELEGFALLPFLGGLIAGAASVVKGFSATPSRRAANALAFVIFGGGLLWLLGIQFEAWGVQSCFKP